MGSNTTATGRFRNSTVTAGALSSRPARRFGSAVLSAAWIAAAAVVLFPLLWSIINSFKASNLEIFEHPLGWPAAWSLDGYRRALVEGNIFNCFVNSLLTTALSTALVLFLGAWAGYALRGAPFPGRRTWLALFMIAMILPTQAYLLPLLDLIGRLGLDNTLWALIFSYAAQNLPLAILLFAAFFQSLPKELEEVARLDGLGTARYYLQILLPIGRPVAGSVAVITALNSWNEFLMALLFVTEPQRKTLPAGMVAFEQVHNTDYPALLAGLTLSSITILVACWIFNRQIVSGLTAGAVK